MSSLPCITDHSNLKIIGVGHVDITRYHITNTTQLIYIQSNVEVIMSYRELPMHHHHTLGNSTDQGGTSDLETVGRPLNVILN